MVAVLVMLLATNKKAGYEHVFHQLRAMVLAAQQPTASRVLNTTWLTFGVPFESALSLRSLEAPTRAAAGGVSSSCLDVDGWLYTFLAAVQFVADRRAVYPTDVLGAMPPHMMALPEPPVSVIIVSDNPHIARTVGKAALSVAGGRGVRRAAPDTVPSQEHQYTALQKHHRSSSFGRLRRRSSAGHHGGVGEEAAADARGNAAEDAFVVVPYVLPGRDGDAAALRQWASYLHQEVHRPQW
jgi:hypothetical protein